MNSGRIMFSSMLPSGSGSGCAPITNTTTSINATGSNSDGEAVATNYWRRGASAQIWTPSELGSSKQITALQYQQSNTIALSSYTYNDIVIRMCHTSSTSFSSTSTIVGTWPNIEIPGLSNKSDEIEVHNGSWSISNSTGWQTLNLDTNFCYNGTDNLVIMIIKDDQDDESYSSTARWRYNGDSQVGSNSFWYSSDYYDMNGLSISPSSSTSKKGDINSGRPFLRVKH